MKKPNIVVFCTDQHPAHWLGCAGNKDIKTPNIDKLAEDGMLFSNAFSNNPVCMPARSTMFTGLPSSEHRARVSGINLDNYFPVLPQILKDNGYKTFSTGKIHLTSWEVGMLHDPEVKNLDPKKYPECSTLWEEGKISQIPDGYFGLDWIDIVGLHGWLSFGNHMNWLKENHQDEYKKYMDQTAYKESLSSDNGRYAAVYSTLPKELHYNEWIKNKTIEKIDRVDEDQPFFAWVSYPDPHWPFAPPKPYSEMYDPNQIDKPVAWDDKKEKMPDFYRKSYYEDRNVPHVDVADTNCTLDQIMEIKALAYGSTTMIDESVGGVIDHLKAKGLYDDTIFIFLADHGEAGGDHRMVDKGPFHYDGIVKIPFIVSYPKKLLKGKKSEAMVSLLDFMPTILDLAGVDYPQQETKEWQGIFPNHPRYEGEKILPGNSLVPILIGASEELQDYVLIEDDEDMRKRCLRTLVTHEYKMTIFKDREEGILFDRIKDPDEVNNVFNDPEYADVKIMMKDKMIHALLNNMERINRSVSIA